MISLRARDLRDLSADELADAARRDAEGAVHIRFQSATGALENITRLRLTRREIARILTVQHEQARALRQTEA